MKRLIVFCFSMLGVLASVLAQNQSFWEKVKGPPGGDVKVTRANDGTLYSQALGAGMYKDNLGKVFRSTDSGNTWETLQIPTSFGSSVAKAVIGPSRNFYILNNEVSSQYYLYKSTDEGQSWEIKVMTSEYQHFVFETRSGVLLRSSGDRLRRSMDGGDSWTTVLTITSNDKLVEMTQMPNGDLVAYLTEYKRWYWSKDDGASWKALPQAPSSEAVTVFFTLQGTWLCYDSKNMYRSQDEGTTWSTTTFPQTSFLNSMCLLPSGRVLYGRQLKEALYSDDDGLTWQLLGSSVHHFVLPEALPNGDILAVHHAALHRSGDGGATWHFLSEGIRLGGVGAMKFESEDTLFAVTATGVWRTFDAGTQWSQVVSKRDVIGLYQYNGYAPHWFDKGAGGRLAAFDGDSLLLSSDWGDHFSRIVSPDNTLNNTRNPKIKVSPDGFTLFVHGNGLYRSNDWGVTWKKLLAQEVQSFEIHSSGRLLAVRDYNRLWYSDNGTDWVEALFPPLGGQITSLFCSTSGEIIANYNLPNGGGFRFLRSSDAGITWSVQSGSFCPYYLIDNAAGHLFGIAGLSKPYLSLDEGVQWQTMPDFDGQHYSWAISPSQYLYVGVDGVSLYRTRRPTTEGAYLTGTVQADADADCTTPDAQPSPSRSWSVKAEGEDIWYGNTDSTGRYRMFIDTGTYQVGVRPPHPLWWSICESPQTASLPQLFDADTIEFSAAALLDCPLMQVDVAAPRLRRCFDNSVYVQYCNIGSETADSAWVEIEIDPYLTLTSAQLPYESLGPKHFRFNLGSVQPGVCEQFQFTVHVDCDSTVLGQTHCILAHAWPDTLCAPVNGWSGANIEAEAHCLGDTMVQLTLRNTGTGISQMLEYIIIEDLIVLDMGDNIYEPGEELVINMPAQGRTWRIESQQEPGHPFSNLAIAFTEGCEGFNSLGFINQFNVNGIRPAWNRFCLGNTGSYDPNDKQGFPLGYGAENRIRPGQDLEYLIRFQNTGTDTAFTVIIRDTLSAWLDAASVRPGAASHPYTWNLSGQGVLTFRFNNILLPDSTTNLEGSQGFISFHIEQQPNVPLGAKILNEANIYFDFNAPIVTNQTLHTVGLDIQSGTDDLPHARLTDAVLVQPNPVAESTVFRLREGAFQQHRLTLTDALGRTVRQCPMTGSQYIFDRKNLPAGVYAYRVEDAKGRTTGSGKVLLK